MWNVFEQPWSLLAIAVSASLIILIIHSMFPEKRHLWYWALPLLVAAAAFGLDVLVKTDTEKITLAIDTIVKAVEEENCPAIEQVLSENYRDSYHSSKRSIMNHCRRVLAEPLVERNIKTILSLTISTPKSTTIFVVRVIFDKQGFAYQNFTREMYVKVKADLQKQQNRRWLINRIEILEINRQPAAWKSFNNW